MNGKHRARKFLVMLAFLLVCPVMNAQEANYDETKVPNFELPDPLKFKDKSSVVTPDDWTKRRSEILQQFQDHVYGAMPDERWFSSDVVREVLIELDQPTNDESAGGTISAKLREVDFRFDKNGGGPVAHLLILLPVSSDESSDAGNAVPVFLGYNFGGNHTIHPDERISKHPVWTRDRKLELPLDKTRGAKQSRWPVHRILSNGFGLATLYYGDVDPDFDDGFQNGVHPLYPKLQNRPDNWTSIGAWAWGLHRVMDYFEHSSDIDHEKVAVLGHSRLGKTSLWTGATDERFAIVISNDSGCGGAALARRQFGETVARINKAFPHWFCQRHKDYNNQEEKLPVDQHMLVSLIAPRPVYVASAAEDLWADPKGEFLSAFHAQPVYQLLGQPGLGIDAPDMPKTDQPIGETIGYHVRTGKHDLKTYDWVQYIKFAKRHFQLD